MKRNSAEHGIPNRGGSLRWAACHFEGPGHSSRKTKQRKKASKTLAFFCLGGGAFPGSCLWRCFAGGRSLFAARRIRAFVHGKIFAKCVLERLAAAIFRRGTFPGGRPWQFSRFMYPKSALGREKRPSLATYRRCVSKMSWLWQDLRAMYPKSPANRLSGMHSARILPGRGAFRRTGPSNHARRANPAIPPTAPNRPNARNPCAMAPSGHSGHRQQHQRRHPRHHRFAGSPCWLRPIDRLPSLSAVPRSHPLQLRLPWRSTFPTRDASLRLFLCFRQLRSAYKRQTEPLQCKYFAMVA